LAVNKTDLKDTAKLSAEEIQEKYGGEFVGLFYVSAQTGENVDPLFNCVAIEASKFYRTLATSRPNPTPVTEEQEGSCC
jgi:GTPase Era involved in 16S rRNA processing